MVALVVDGVGAEVGGRVGLLGSHSGVLVGFDSRERLGVRQADELGRARGGLRLGGSIGLLRVVGYGAGDKEVSDL